MGACSQRDDVPTVENAQSCAELAEVFEIQTAEASSSERRDLVAEALERAQQLGSSAAQDSAEMMMCGAFSAKLSELVSGSE